MNMDRIEKYFFMMLAIALTSIIVASTYVYLRENQKDDKCLTIAVNEMGYNEFDLKVFLRVSAYNACDVTYSKATQEVFKKFQQGVSPAKSDDGNKIITGLAIGTAIGLSSRGR